MLVVEHMTSKFCKYFLPVNVIFLDLKKALDFQEILEHRVALKLIIASGSTYCVKSEMDKIIVNFLYTLCPTDTRYNLLSLWGIVIYYFETFHYYFT